MRNAGDAVLAMCLGEMDVTSVKSADSGDKPGQQTTELKEDSGDKTQTGRQIVL